MALVRCLEAEKMEVKAKFIGHALPPIYQHYLRHVLVLQYKFIYHIRIEKRFRYSKQKYFLCDTIFTLRNNFKQLHEITNLFFIMVSKVILAL